MALSLTYPLKKGTYHRVRGFKAHQIANPGTWYGIDDGCKVGTPLYAVTDGKVSWAEKTVGGGGWNFKLSFSKYPGWWMWYAHCSSLPPKGKTFKRGQVIAKSGATGGVTGPHLHYSLLKGNTPLDPDKYVKWGEVEDMYKGKNAQYWYNAYAKYKPAYVKYLAAYKKYSTAYTKVKKYLADRDKKISTLNTIIEQQASQVKTLSGQVNELQEELKEATVLVQKQNDAIAELEGKILTLDEKLKRATAEPDSPTDPNPGWTWEIVSKFFRDLFNKRI